METEMMESIGVLFTAGLIVLAALCTICVWAPRRPFVKVGALAFAGMFIPIGYVSLAELMSKPKPVELEWWLGQSDEATVIASTMEEGKGIYLWLQLAQVAEPRAYVLPWSRELAEQLQEAMREAESSKGGVGMRLPFESSLDDREPRFYALPQPALPPKDLTHPPAQRYKPPEVSA
jgi:hypothetical protein